MSNSNIKSERMKQWRYMRNNVMLELMTAFNLKPSQIADLKVVDLYKNNRPVEHLVVKGKKYKMPKKIRTWLSLMNLQPLLITDWPLTQKFFCNRPQGHALSTGHIRKIKRFF